MVFGVRGLYSNWFLPVAYSFVSGTMAPTDIVNAINDITLMCKEVGIKLIATCCDQNSNVSCINEFRWQTEQSVWKINEKALEEMGFKLLGFQL